MSEGELILYTTEDGLTEVSLRSVDNTVWLTQAQMSELFQASPQAVTQLVRAIYRDRELSERATCKNFLQVRTEGAREVRRQLKHYNLEMILAVGYRVRSPRGVQFRRWANIIIWELPVGKALWYARVMWVRRRIIYRLMKSKNSTTLSSCIWTMPKIKPRSAGR